MRGLAASGPHVFLPVRFAVRFPMPGPLNPTRKKHRFGKAWMHDHVNDPYVQEAQRRGYRSRAAFKLLELDERDKLLRPGIVAVDLGSAPGSWCQVLRERLGPKATIVAVDVLPMHPVAGVAFVQADFATDEGLAAVEAALAGRPVDLVVSDMAPNLSGIDPVDQARSVGLADLALAFAGEHLQPGGDFAVKVFQGAGLAEFEGSMRERFDKVYLRKPKASRDRSREVFLVGKGFSGG
jgi:23S rRNA (uridine2552-2'-O)-methyltransferase